MTTIKNVLHVYKNLLKMCQSLPTAHNKRSDTIKTIKKEFRLYKNETNIETINELLVKANSSLGYLKIITPKNRTFSKQTEHFNIKFGDKDNSPSRKAVSNWHGSNMDPDQVKRHYNGLKRAGFTDNASVNKGLF
jgi:hypothetical protein